MAKFIAVTVNIREEEKYRVLINTAHIVSVEFKYANNARVKTSRDLYFVTKEEGERIESLLIAE